MDPGSLPGNTELVIGNNVWIQTGRGANAHRHSGNRSNKMMTKHHKIQLAKTFESVSGDAIK